MFEGEEVTGRERERADELDGLLREVLVRWRHLAQTALTASRTEPRPSPRTNVRKALDRLEELAETDLLWLEERRRRDG